jgi:glycosyltransferase involved in cell wall biosynthesis
MKKVLIVSYAFAPLTVAGVFRVLRMAKYLPRFGWTPIVLTTRPRPGVLHDHDLLKEVSAEAEVHRTRRWDPLGYLFLRNQGSGTQPLSRTVTLPKEPGPASKVSEHALRKTIRLAAGMASTPDPQIYWVPFAVMKGLRIFLKSPFDAILTTSPPHSSHLAGFILSKVTRRPWVADFRDPWLDHPLRSSMAKSALQDRVEENLESFVVRHASRVIANTTSNKKSLERRYRDLHADMFRVITNGFDKEFVDAVEPIRQKKLTVCHLGTFYPQLEPYFFFEALARWIEIRGGDALAESFQVLLIDSGEPILRRIVADLKLDRYVQFLERVPNRESVSLAKGSDLLLVSLGFSEKARGWAPLKLYEYFGCEKPILALVPQGSLVADIVKSTGTGVAVSEPSFEEVFRMLDHSYRHKFGNSSSNGFNPDRSQISAFEQSSLIGHLAALLDEITDKR